MALLFSKNKKNEIAYNRQKVDTFFSQVQTAYDANIESLDILKIANAAFPIEKEGYSSSQVDFAIQKLIYSILEYRKTNAYKSGNKESWEKEHSRSVYDLEKTLKSEKDKFFAKPEVSKKGEKKLRKKERAFTYKTRSVDKFMKKLEKYFFESGNKIEINEIENLSFPSSKSAKGYLESEVDAFLNKVKILLIASNIKPS
ncbi:MAG: hypothetical protein LBB07_01620 [Bifidobacteriaceae bacterium]|jgi:DivIVA domain-containing protein|nr:hypothetical protein [Bifidobacteriaceae bacterium]